MKTVLAVLIAATAAACGIKKSESTALATSSKVIQCGDKAKNTVTVKFSREKMTATLVENSGPDKGKVLKALKCSPDQGAIEAAFSCSFFTSTDSGYAVKIASIGSASLYGSAQPWTMTGNGKIESLGECK